MSITSVAFGMHAISNSWTPSAPAHAGYGTAKMIQLAAEGGATLVRIPLSLAYVSSTNPSDWMGVVNDIGNLLRVAANNGIKVILQPGQTPLDIVDDPTDMPQTAADITKVASRYAALVNAVHENYSQYESTIAGWEVGNEPNLGDLYTGRYWDDDPNAPVDAPRYYSVSLDNAPKYASYLAQVAQKVHAYDDGIKVISAGIAHNDKAYMDAMLSELRRLDADIDGFALHPYTTYASNAFDGGSPASGRPTDWVPSPTAQPWEHYYSFQGALNNYQSLLKEYGYAGADLWLTEFGVPSYKGMRGAGKEGKIDQAFWYAEALGVLDSLGNDKLKGIVAHAVLDNDFAEANNGFNAYDGDSGNDGDVFEAEASFGLYERREGEVPVAKLALKVVDAIANGENYANANIRILSYATQSNVDLTNWGANGEGIVPGYVVFTHGGTDTVTGSTFGDSIFAGDGSDVVAGSDGADRLYGGSGNDTLRGGDARDDLYGNLGQDTLIGGAGKDRMTGGDGNDTLNGGADADILVGGSGSDGLTGGSGADMFVYAARSDSTVGSDGRDTVLDFNRTEGDKIDLWQIDAKASVADNQAFTFIGTAGFHGVAGELRVQASASAFLVSGDTNGDAVADFTIRVEGATSLNGGDFVL